MLLVWLVLSLQVFADLALRLSLYSALYLLLIISEARLRNFNPNSGQVNSFKRYQTMRWVLTLTVVSCHLILIFSLGK